MRSRPNSSAFSIPEQGHNCRDLLRLIERVDVVDDFTVNVVTRYPFGAFEPMMAHVSAAIRSPERTDSGTGPYKLRSWRKDLELVLEETRTTGERRDSSTPSSTVRSPKPPRASSRSSPATWTSSPRSHPRI
jgi:ABC-type transport system substrate-binding protein